MHPLGIAVNAPLENRKTPKEDTNEPNYNKFDMGVYQRQKPKNFLNIKI